MLPLAYISLLLSSEMCLISASGGVGGGSYFLYGNY